MPETSFKPKWMSLRLWDNETYKYFFAEHYYMKISNFIIKQTSCCLSKGILSNELLIIIFAKRINIKKSFGLDRIVIIDSIRAKNCITKTASAFSLIDSKNQKN